MANNKESRNPIIKGLQTLNKSTKATNVSLYGIGSDIPGTTTTELDYYISKINEDMDNDKALINSHVSRSKLYNSSHLPTNLNKNSIYNVINDSMTMNSVQSLIGGENIKFAQLLKDYEIIKRCIPQIHKVVASLKNNIISPDAMTSSAIGIELPSMTDQADRDKIGGIIEKYKLNSKLDDWVMDYLIASVRYTTVVPYSAIPDMLDAKYETMEECIELLGIEKPRSLLECASKVSNSEILTESVEFNYNDMNVDYYENDDIDEKLNVRKATISPEMISSAVNECLSNIEFINGGMAYFKNAILNEATVASDNFSKNTSMKQVLKRMASHSKRIDKNKLVQTSEGLVEPEVVNKIRKNVDFKGCHIEELNATKVIPFKLRDTIVGYFYVEDIGSPELSGTGTNQLSSIMDKINASVYMKNDTANQAARVEYLVIKSISEKMVRAIDDKFINDNYEDMDIIYEFVRACELHKRKNKRVVFFHPDDICEFRRKDGSIMKNCMFMAKLYILTMLSNVLTNVTRGADRQLYYLKTGLTTDIEGHVNSAIRAIKQGQIRYSDIGTINEVFNIVGANVDAFMPVSVDGERPIDVETISGQNVDMNNDFLQSLLKSIVQSFGVPSSVIDDFENIDFAKTISMSNLDMARAVLNAQLEICEPLTKLIRRIVSYELPDYKYVDEIEAKLNPPLVIVTEMNNERINSLSQMADTLSALLFAPEGEALADKQIRLFKLEYFKKNMPTIDWDSIAEMVDNVRRKAKVEETDVGIESQSDTSSGYEQYDSQQQSQW